LTRRLWRRCTSNRRHQATERLALGPAYQDHRLAFCQEDGTPLPPGRVSKLFARHVDALGATRITLHGLRHTWASLALQAGINPKVVSERLGHTTVSFTLDTYSHVMPGIRRTRRRESRALVFNA
jgi:integrase